MNAQSLVPKTTTSLANTAQADRNRQAKAYNKDVSHNQSQMDSIRHAQYSKQNKAVNTQKSQMQRNAAKSSRKVTGTTDFYKEGKTFDDFICEAPALPAAGGTGRGGPLARRPVGGGVGAKRPQGRQTQTDANSDVIDVEVQDVTSRGKRPKTGMGKRDYRQARMDMDNKRFAYQQQRDKQADDLRRQREEARRAEQERKEKEERRRKFGQRAERILGNPLKDVPSLYGMAKGIGRAALDTSNKGMGYQSSGGEGSVGSVLPQVDD